MQRKGAGGRDHSAICGKSSSSTQSRVAGAIVVNETTAGGVEEAQRLLRHQLGRERQNGAVQRHGPAPRGKQAARRDHRHVGPLGGVEADRMRGGRAGQRPAKARMQADRIGQGPGIAIGRAEARSRARPDAARSAPRAERRKGRAKDVSASASSARQAEPADRSTSEKRLRRAKPCRPSGKDPIADARLAAPRPADDGKKQGRGLAPDGGVRRPEEIGLPRTPIGKLARRAARSRRDRRRREGESVRSWRERADSRRRRKRGVAIAAITRPAARATSRRSGRRGPCPRSPRRGFVPRERRRPLRMASRETRDSASPGSRSPRPDTSTARPRARCRTRRTDRREE